MFLCGAGEVQMPDAGVLVRALHGVLSQYGRRQQLISDLLAATQQAAENEEALQRALRCAACVWVCVD
jgi:hypothetical protein